MEFIHQLDPMTAIILIAATLIVVLVLFSKFMHIILKLAIIAVMVFCMLYFLRQAGII